MESQHTSPIHLLPCAYRQCTARVIYTCQHVHHVITQHVDGYDAQAFSDRAGSVKKEIGMEDVMMAIQAKATTSFVTPPSQEVRRLHVGRHVPVLLMLHEVCVGLA